MIPSQFNYRNLKGSNTPLQDVLTVFENSFVPCGTLSEHEIRLPECHIKRFQNDTKNICAAVHFKNTTPYCAEILLEDENVMIEINHYDALKSPSTGKYRTKNSRTKPQHVNQKDDINIQKAKQRLGFDL